MSAIYHDPNYGLHYRRTRQIKWGAVALVFALAFVSGFICASFVFGAMQKGKNDWCNNCKDVRESFEIFQTKLEEEVESRIQAEVTKRLSIIVDSAGCAMTNYVNTAEVKNVIP